MIATDIFTPDMVPDDEWLEQEKKRPANRKDTPATKPASENPEVSENQPVAAGQSDNAPVADTPAAPEPSVTEEPKDGIAEEPAPEPEPVPAGDAVEEENVGAQEDTDSDMVGDDIDDDANKHLSLMTDKKKKDLGVLLPKEQTPLPVGTEIKYGRTTYRIVQFINRGGFALTYKVCIDGVRSSYILKEFCPKNARRHECGTIQQLTDDSYKTGLGKFRLEPDRFDWINDALRGRELEQWVALAHTHVFNNEAGNLYFVQDFVEGETLMDFMCRSVNNDTPMTVSLALDIAEHLCMAVQAIHREGVVHFDLSPNNIMFRIDNQGKIKLKLIDFGLSTNVNGYGLSESAVNGGTEGFRDRYFTRLAESEKGDFKLVDIYSIGAVLNYMLFFNYETVKGGTKYFDYNKSSFESQADRPYVALAKGRDEEKRQAIINLITWCTAEPVLNFEPDFRPDIDRLLMEIQKIKANMGFERETTEQMTQEVPAKGENRTINFHTDMAWQATIEYGDNQSGWISMDKDTGSENDRNIPVTINPNPLDIPREAKIIIESGVLMTPYTVRQEAGVKVKPEIQFPHGAETKTVFNKEGGDKDIVFTSNKEWTAKVVSDKDGWLTVQPDSGLAGTQSVKITASPNTKYEKLNGEIEFSCGGEPIQWTVEQQPADKPFIEFAKDTRPRINVSHTKEQASFSFHTNIDWEATTVDENDLSWVKFDKNHGASGFHTINMELEPNDTNVEREAIVEVYKDETLKIQYQIVQAMKPKTVIPVQPEPPVQPESPTGQPDPVKPETPEPEPQPEPEPEPKKKDKKKKSFLPIVGGLVLCVLLLVGGWLVYPQLKSPASRKAAVRQVEKVVGQVQQAVDKMLSDSSSDRPGTPEVKPTTAAQTTSDVAAPAEQSQPGLETKAPDIKSFNAAVIMALENKEWLETVLGLLHSSVAIYERYGDSDVEVGSTMRQLLQRENANIVLGKTHEVTDLYTDPATGLINEIIIEKKQ